MAVFVRLIRTLSFFHKHFTRSEEAKHRHQPRNAARKVTPQQCTVDTEFVPLQTYLGEETKTNWQLIQKKREKKQCRFQNGNLDTQKE